MLRILNREDRHARFAHVTDWRQSKGKQLRPTRASARRSRAFVEMSFQNEPLASTAIWDDVPPPTPQDVWEENLALVARALV